MASATAAASAAVTAGIEEREQRRASSERRLAEVRQRLVELDPADRGVRSLAALQDFAPLWEVLTVPERERVIQMLIERIDYDGRDGTLRLSYRLAGLAHLAAEAATEVAS